MYKQVAFIENDKIGIKIFMTELTEGEKREVYYIAEDLVKKILSDRQKNDPAAQDMRNKTIRDLVSIFPQTVFVKEIPNEYNNSWVRPWLIVTTTKGHIKVGWRSKVISIDWKDSTQEKIAEELFPEVTSTKYDKVIHAWNYEDAKLYIKRILND